MIDCVSLIVYCFIFIHLYILQSKIHIVKVWSKHVTSICNITKYINETRLIYTITCTLSVQKDVFPYTWKSTWCVCDQCYFYSSPLYKIYRESDLSTLFTWVCSIYIRQCVSASDMGDVQSFIQELGVLDDIFMCMTSHDGMPVVHNDAPPTMIAIG